VTEADPATVVRRFFDALNRRGIEAFELVHEDAVYVEDPKWPGSDVYRGRDAVAKCWAGYDDLLGGEIRLEVTETDDVGDHVVAVVKVTGRSREAGIPFDQTWGYVCRTEGGRLSYFRAYLDPAEAAAAAL
jgi:ketosteroid isomerase-like protein